MEKKEFEEAREFARTLNQKRVQLPDGQLLNECQVHLNALVEHLADEFEEAPHINEAEPAVPKKRSHHKKKVTSD